MIARAPVVQTVSLEGETNRNHRTCPNAKPYSTAARAIYTVSGLMHTLRCNAAPIIHIHESIWILCFGSATLLVVRSDYLSVSPELVERGTAESGLSEN